MTLRAWLINGTNINQDYDFGMLLQAIAPAGGYIEWLDVQTGLVKAGKGFIPCTRTNGDKPYVFVELSADYVVDTTGSKKVWIEIPQAKLDDGSTNSEDGTGIAIVNTGASYPSANYIPLASITGGSITDERVALKIWADRFSFTKWLRDLTDVYNFTTPTTKKFLVWDIVNSKWNLWDVESTDVPQPAALVITSDYPLGEPITDITKSCVFKETAPTFAQATTAQNIWDVAGNTRVSFPAIGTGVAGNSLKLSLAKVLSPTAFCRVRIETDNAGSPSGTLVDANATKDIDPATLTTSLADTTVTFPWSFTVPQVKVHTVVGAVW
jgi:hypothetical protein